MNNFEKFTQRELFRVKIICIALLLALLLFLLWICLIYFPLVSRKSIGWLGVVAVLISFMPSYVVIGNVFVEIKYIAGKQKYKAAVDGFFRIGWRFLAHKRSSHS